MTNADESWAEVGEHFSRLGKTFRRHYADQEGAEEAGADIKDAFKGLAEAAERVATTVGEAFKDPEVKVEAKEAANSIVAAIGTTFGEVSDELKRVLSGSEVGGDEVSEEADAQAAEEVVEAAGEVDFDDPDQTPAAGDGDEDGI